MPSLAATCMPYQSDIHSHSGDYVLKVDRTTYTICAALILYDARLSDREATKENELEFGTSRHLLSETS